MGYTLEVQISNGFGIALGVMVMLNLLNSPVQPHFNTESVAR